MTEQYQQPSINLADTRPGIPTFIAQEFDAVNPTGTTDTTGARFLNPVTQGGINYFLPVAGEASGDAGQIIFTSPGVYSVEILVGPVGATTAVGITWSEVPTRPLITTDPSFGVNSVPAGLADLQAYGRNNALTVLFANGTLLVAPQVSESFPLVAFVNITPAAAASSTVPLTRLKIVRVAPLGS